MPAELHARATVLVAMPGALRERFFTPALWATLTAAADVVLSPTPATWDPPAAALLARADVLVTGWGTARVDGSLLAGAPRLRAVIHTAGSVREIVDPAVFRRGVRVSSQAAANALPVAEYTVAAVLFALKGVFRAQRAYRAARGPVDVDGLLAGLGTYGRRVGVVGASKIGRRVLDLLRPFTLDVVLADPTLDAPAAAALGARLVPLPDLMRSSDVVSLHAPLLPSTTGMINARLLASMRDGAVLVNTARGALVDEQALVAELRSGRLEAVIDVTDPEVPDPLSPLWDLPNLWLTPHIAGARGTELHRLGEGAVAEVLRALDGEDLAHEITAESYAGLA